MNKSLKAIIDEGVKELEGLAESVARRDEQAREIIERCKADMAALVRFAEDLPQKMLDKMSLVMTTDFNFGMGHGQASWSSLEICGQRQGLRGMFGGDDKIQGKYRAVVILSKVD